MTVGRLCSRLQDLVTALTAATAVTSLVLPVLDDQQLMEQLAYVEKQKGLPNAAEARQLQMLAERFTQMQEEGA